jgi:hypothetical protein
MTAAETHAVETATAEACATAFASRPGTGAARLRVEPRHPRQEVGVTATKTHAGRAATAVACVSSLVGRPGIGAARLRVEPALHVRRSP